MKIPAALLCATLCFGLTATEAAERSINLTLYYETICPDTKDFVLDQLVPVYGSPLKSHINLELVPFGNAEITYPNGTDSPPVVECQHKELECYGNRLQGCFIALYSAGVEQSLDYIRCMFAKDNWRRPDETAPQCASELGLDWEAIKTCTDSQVGENLVLQNGNKTKSLDPKVTWIPWITINGNHTADMKDEALDGLKEYLCTKHLAGVEACKSAGYSVVQSLTLLVVGVVMKLW